MKLNLSKTGLSITQHEFEKLSFDEQSSLNELIQNGYAENLDDELIHMPFSSIYKLTETGIQSLGLPEFYPFELYIRTNGKALVENDFNFVYDFLSYSGLGDRFNYTVVGNFLLNDQIIEYVLDDAQFQVCTLINENNQFTSLEEKLLFLHQLKKKSLISNISFDAILANEEIEIPSELKLTIKQFDDGLIQFRPVLLENEEEQNKLLKSFEMFPNVKNIYNLQNSEGKRKRVIVSKDHNTQLEVFKTQLKEKKTKQDAKVIIENIYEYFDDDIIDIEVVYSDRVKGIGLYEPKYYPFIQPYKSQWIAGIEVKSPKDGTKRIHVKNQDELNELKSAILTSKKNGATNVNYKGETIPIAEAEKLAKIAEEQLKNPKEPIEKQSFEVLIIKENAELLEYGSSTTYFENLKEYDFYTISNLNSAFDLKGHQREGIAWLQYLLLKNASGGLLADDMGLGKTIQILYFIEWHFQNKNEENRPYLIIAPVSLIENWENEYAKFFKPCSLNISTIYGENVPATKEVDSDFIAKYDKAEILLTNYETIRNYQKTLCAIDFSIVVIDEAQKVKTPGTLVTNSVKAIKSDFKIALTGTPVENSLVDLWCIIDFVAPGLLNTAKDFAKKYQTPLKDAETDIIKHGEMLRNEIGYFLTRRIKQDVAKDLPEKHIKRYEIEMTDYHEEIYLE